MRRQTRTSPSWQAAGFRSHLWREKIFPNYALYSLDPAQCLPRYRHTQTGERVDNITDWALNKFVGEYGKKAGVTKDAIFAYCYAVLHDPVYREKYALNLKREFPRIPFYADFANGRAGASS